MISNTKIKSNSDNSNFEPLPADVYQVQITDVEEREGTKYGTQDKIMQFMFKAEVVEGDEEGKRLVFFTSESWFNGGKNGSKASKLYNLMKTVYGTNTVEEMDEITDKEINGLIGQQVRLTVEVTDKNRNKVAGFLPIKKTVKYHAETEAVDPDLDVPFTS
jgi:hypothetical protein